MAQDQNKPRGLDHAAGQQKQHQVRNRTTGEIVNPSPTQADWRDKSRFPRDQFERVDESGNVVPDEGGDSGSGSTTTGS